MAQFNHPKEPEDPFASFLTPYAFGLNAPTIRDKMFAVETANGWRLNAGEYYLSEYAYILDQGWWVAPTAGQDLESLDHPIYSHRTVYIGQELSREELYLAMMNRRMYSTDDPTLKIVFKAGPHWMGSQLPKPNRVTFFVQLRDLSGDFDSLELITQYGEVADTLYDYELPDDWEEGDPINWTVSVSNPNDYYFVKVTETGDEGNLVAVSAPIFFY